jgi:hypothetical protein
MSKPTLHELFDAPAPKLAPLSHEEELDLALRAQAGDEDAYNELLRQFIPALRGYAITEARRANGYVDRDETRANILLAFAEAVAKVSATYHFNGALKSTVRQTADSYQLVGAVAIPERTRSRFLEIARSKGGNLKEAEAVAHEFGMTPEVFRAVAEALNLWGSYEATVDAPGVLDGIGNREPATYPLVGNPAEDETAVDIRLLVDAAFAAVDETTGGVIADAYGFSDYEPLPDAEIAHRRGYSRSKVQRIRTEGLVAMHAATCDGEETRCARTELHPERAEEPLAEWERELLAAYDNGKANA